METIIYLVIVAFVVFTTLIIILSRYRKCPSDKIMVIYGKVGSNPDGSSRSARCVHGGAAFIWPIFQSFEYMDLTPISISVDLTNALSRQNIRIDVPSRFTVGISTEPGVMQNAAERLLGLKMAEIQALAQDAISGNVETELKKIGLRLINVNVTDISDESGYIIALGKEAAAKAINDAKKSVAEADREGAIGEANANRDKRVQVSLADSEAIQGENSAKAEIADSDATRREREAEAQRRAVSAEKIASAKSLEEAYAAEQTAELARAARERATLEADVLVKAEIDKKQLEIAAEAEAEQLRRRARGEADAIFAKMEAEGRGLQEVLTRQAAGLAEVVKAAGGNANDAIRLLVADKLEELVRIQVEAVKNLKIDKVTVWDGGSKDGTSSTANFVSGLMKSIPPMSELFNMAGMELPEYLGKTKDNSNAKEEPVPAETVPGQV